MKIPEEFVFFNFEGPGAVCVCVYAGRPTVKFSLYILDKSTLKRLSFSFKVIQGNPPRWMWGPWVLSGWKAESNLGVISKTAISVSATERGIMEACLVCMHGAWTLKMIK